MMSIKQAFKCEFTKSGHTRQRGPLPMIGICCQPGQHTIDTSLSNDWEISIKQAFYLGTSQSRAQHGKSPLESLRYDVHETSTYLTHWPNKATIVSALSNAWDMMSMKLKKPFDWEPAKAGLTMVSPLSNAWDKMSMKQAHISCTGQTRPRKLARYPMLEIWCP